MADPISEPTIVPISPAVAEAMSEGVHKASIHAPRYSGRQQDGCGVPITQIFAAESGKYAIYQASEVMVHFADDPEKQQTQRKAILPVSSGLGFSPNRL
jgi:hypothetical protein